MSDKTKIEWTDATWNPVTGCTKVSPGCDHCYAERVTERFHGRGSFATVKLHEERLGQPLRWTRPRRIFVNSMSDLFHDQVPDMFIADIFAVMARAPQHTFQILTKRHSRMRSLVSGDLYDLMAPVAPKPVTWPLPNVWLGVSVEDQKWADIRIPALLETPAAVGFLSCEPLLGPVSLHRYLPNGWGEGTRHNPRPSNIAHPRPTVDWVIVGGESGNGARPMHPDWARKIRDQCVNAGVPFLFKQWGEWAPTRPQPGNGRTVEWLSRTTDADGYGIARVGKKPAGRELDGRTWDEYPPAVTP